MADREFHRAMDLVMEAGKLLLASGGEVFRAQSTMEIMAESLGIKDFHVYVLTNGIFASALQGTVSEVRHIPSVTVNLGRVEAVNAISRQLAAGALDLEAAERALAEAQRRPIYGPRRQLLAAALGSACFAFLFGGRGAEALAAFAAGALETLVCQQFGRRRISRIFTDIVAAALCTAVCIAARGLLWPRLDVNTAIIGALMVLTPGVALTMGIRDIINADYLSGAIRLLGAVLVAGCLAAGVGLTWMVARLCWGVRG